MKRITRKALALLIALMLALPTFALADDAAEYAADEWAAADEWNDIDEWDGADDGTVLIDGIDPEVGEADEFLFGGDDLPEDEDDLSEEDNDLPKDGDDLPEDVDDQPEDVDDQPEGGDYLPEGGDDLSEDDPEADAAPGNPDAAPEIPEDAEADAKDALSEGDDLAETGTEDDTPEVRDDGDETHNDENEAPDDGDETPDNGEETPDDENEAPDGDQDGDTDATDGFSVYTAEFTSEAVEAVAEAAALGDAIVTDNEAFGDVTDQEMRTLKVSIVQPSDGADIYPTFSLAYEDGYQQNLSGFGSSRSASVPCGQTFTLSSGPHNGRDFGYWAENGEIIGREEQIELTMDADREITAVFYGNQVVVQVNLQGREWRDDDAFSFELTPLNGAPNPSPSWEDLTHVTVTKSSLDHGEAFGSVSFNLRHSGKQFEYKVTPTQVSADNLTCQTEAQTVTYYISGEYTVDVEPSRMQIVEFTYVYEPDAVLPAITRQPADLSLTEGYSGGALSVAVKAEAGHTYAYQWYVSATASNAGGRAIDGATAATYALPAGKPAGTEEYYYCVVTAQRGAKTATAASKAAKVTVSAKPAPAPLPPVDPNAMPIATFKTKGANALGISWTRVEGAEGYDVFFKVCDGKGNYPLYTTVGEGSNLTAEVTGLKKGAAYKAYVVAWRMENGVKTAIGKAGPVIHAIAGGYNRKWCNARAVTVKRAKVTLKVGGKKAVRAGVKALKKRRKVLKHVSRLRYYTSNPAVATVSQSGRITGVGAGSCTVYVLANNGVYKAVKVTVK